MYTLRGIAVCFSSFFLVYAGASAAVILLRPRVCAYAQKRSPQICSNFLFSVRISPLLLTVLTTFLFAAPSFVMFEPRTVDEPIGACLPFLAFGGLAVIVAGLWNSISALRRISQTLVRWERDASALNPPAGIGKHVTLLRTTATAPPLTAAGIFRPSVWLSSAAASVLSESELGSALRHEFVHVERRDNLKKLLLRFVAFPGMAELESAWREAMELAADDGAVSNALEALDLAAAVIKLSRLAPMAATGELATSLVQSPAQSIHARVSRLLAWTGRPDSQARSHWMISLLCAAATLATLALTYSQLLRQVHAATEWLVR